MATHIDSRALKIISSSYGNLFSEKHSKDDKSKARIPDRRTLENLHKQMFSGGVRAPLLTDSPCVRISSRQDYSDVNFRYSQMGKSISGSRNSVQKLEKEKTTLSLQSLSTYPRVFKFLLPNGSVKTSKSGTPETMSREEKDEWDRWKESVASAKDARDVLYRNAISKDRKIRFHSSKLPRVPAEVRPWTVDEKKVKQVRKNNLVLDCSKESSPDITQIVPQPCRLGVVNRHFRRHTYKSLDNAADITFLEVRRIKANYDISKGELGQYTTNVQQPFEIHMFDDAKNRTERPLKYENINVKPVYRPYKNYTQIPSIPRASVNKDYRSVEAYKQYLQTAQDKVVVEGRKQSIRDREKSDISQYGFENRVLQSVINVNQPTDLNLAEQIKQNETKLENGANGADNKTEENHTNRSNKSIVVEIKPTWKEKEEIEGIKIHENVQQEHDVDGQNMGMIHVNNLAPANSPEPRDPEDRGN